MNNEGPSTLERVSGNLFIRECRMPRQGDVLPFHIHEFDHTMFFQRGRARLSTITADAEPVVEDIEAPSDRVVAAGVKHSIEAMTDDVLFCCVFPHRDALGKIVLQPADQKAYW